jgi:hypothetical protein
MKAAIILSLLEFSLCVAASADEAADKDCMDAGARRAQAIPGAVIKASRVRKRPSAVGARNDPSLTLEVEISPLAQSTRPTSTSVSQILVMKQA